MEELRREVYELSLNVNLLSKDAAETKHSLSTILNACNKLSVKVTDLATAFPNGDTEAHRKVHEAMLQAAEAQEVFWKELRLDLAKKGIWAVFMTIVGLAIAGLGAKFGLVPKI